MTKDKRYVPANMQLEGTLEILARDGDDDDKMMSRRFLLVANTGRPMKLGGFPDPVVIDLAGAKFEARRTPVIADHDPRSRIGHTVAQAIIKAGEEKEIEGRTFKGPLIVAFGVTSSQSQFAREFVADADGGFPFQVSVGADIESVSFLDDGLTQAINGRDVRGPLFVVGKSFISELSVLTLGADRSTSARMVAGQTGAPLQLSFTDTFLEVEMAKETNTNPDSNTDSNAKPDLQATNVDQALSADSTPDLQARSQEAMADFNRRMAANTERVSGIQALAAEFADAKDIQIGEQKFANVQAAASHAIEHNLDRDQFELLCRRHSQPTNVAIHSARQVQDIEAGAVTAALLKASGRVPMSAESNSGKWGIEHWYDQKTLEASDHPELRHCSLHQVFDLIIRAANGSGYQGNRKTEGFLHAARDAMRKLRTQRYMGVQASGFSVHQATDIFDDLANKFLWTGFEAVDVVWPTLTAARNVSDFKTHNLYRFFTKGGYEQIGADGQLVHGGAADDQYTHSADTYGKMYGLTRKELRNDDLGAFDALMTSLGMEAARMQEEIVFSAILGQVGTMWTSGNGNLITGASSDLSIDALTTAADDFRKQKEDGAPIMVSPSILLVGSQDEVYASQLMTSAAIREGRGGSATKAQFVENPHAGKYRVVTSTYLNDTGLTRRTTATIGGSFSNQDSDQWFLFADPMVPQGASFVVSLLDGSRTPVIEQSDADFQFLGMQWRAYHDFGCDSAAYQFSLRAAGA